MIIKLTMSSKIMITTATTTTIIIIMHQVTLLGCRQEGGIR